MKKTSIQRFNLSAWALKHQQFIVFLMLVIVVMGILSYQKLPRDEDPAFTIKTAVVSARWSGANAQDMVNLVTDRLEQKIQDLPYLDDVQSYTRPGETTVFVNLRDDTPPKEVPKLWQKLRNDMSDQQSDLPDGVQGPLVDDQFDSTYGTIYGFVADAGFSNLQLQDKVNHIRRALKEIPDIGKISLLGVQDPQVTIAISPQKLASLDLNLNSVIQAIQAQNRITPIDSLRTPNEKMSIRISGAYQDVQDIQNIHLHIGQKFIALKDIASIAVEPSLPAQPMFRVNGKPAIGLAIAMAKGGNILAFGHALSNKMQQIQQQFPVGIDVIKVADQAAIVHDAVNEFLHVLVEALMIVIAVSFLSLGLRAGFVVAMAIPLVLALTFMGMQSFGIGLQRISLGALILALGLLVDDAMITVETMVSELEAGTSLFTAATTAFKTTAFPMLTGTLVMVSGFIPVGFAASSAGEYCYSLFIVILLALISSWLVAILFSPLSGVWLLKPQAAHATQKPNRFTQIYKTLLDRILKHRVKFILTACLLLLISLWAMTFLEGEFFPASDRPELLINLNLPQNATQQATQQQVSRIEQLLKENSDVDHFSSYIGSGAIRFYLPMDVLLDHENMAQLVVVAKNLKAREHLQIWLDQQLNHQFPNIITRVSPLELGPPVGWPIQYRVSGPDQNQVRTIATQVASMLSQQPQIRDVNLTAGEPERSIQIEVNQTQAQASGLSSEQITSQVAMIFAGQTISQIRNGTHLINVVLKGDAVSRQNPDILKQLIITNTAGQKIPLQQVASLHWGVDDPILWRRQRLPFITVQSDVQAGLHAENVAEQLSSQIQAIQAKLPVGYHIDEDGSIAESNKGNLSVYAVLPITLLVMLILLMIQLQSFLKVFQAIMIAPFGFIGIVAAMLITHSAMGFVALLGIIALSGMIIRNAVILITAVDRNLQQNMTYIAAIQQAAMHRFRPILLTAAAAILGLLPISQQIFWGPMACAMIGGLITATLFTLTLLPAVMSLTHDIKTYFRF